MDSGEPNYDYSYIKTELKPLTAKEIKNMPITIEALRDIQITNDKYLIKAEQSGNFVMTIGYTGSGKSTLLGALCLGP